MTAGREFDRWLLKPPADPNRIVAYVWERPNAASLLEMIRTEAELQAVGRSRFIGTLKQRNELWLSYRNFLRQGISNFRAALRVDNRSASLLYYYAMLNFAKAELLSAGPTAVQGFVSHGLAFNVTKARTVIGDSLTVREGVFRLLYGHRTGSQLSVGTRVPISRLLTHVPEIGHQLTTVKAGATGVYGLLQLVAFDDSSAWTVLAIETGSDLETGSASGKLFRKHFRSIDPPTNWRDRFGVSRRWGAMQFFESLAIFPYEVDDEVSRSKAARAAMDNTWRIKDVLALTTMGMWDAWLAPSLYRSKLVPMPPALARYAVAFYASSLVRYRPSMFDSQVAPEQAFLFDAIARECALPMLVDTVSALTKTDYLFISDDGLRL